ncbi:DUF397 domain-containing protein [Streptomyces tsukubensis]|uniref:DUF397 domain-containing protein n=1 Tax=Streptomyces tsukubensis TaxID=83656 RepID=UPI00098F5B06|nr:DUF397 domain-containing protein [Streptomyces tsukubensis]
MPWRDECVVHPLRDERFLYSALTGRSKSRSGCFTTAYGAIRIRDSKDPARTPLAFGHLQWTAFLRVLIDPL